MKKLFYIIIIIFICFLSFILNKYNNRYYFISYGNYNENTNIIRKKTTLKKIIKDYKNYDYIKIDKIKKEKIIKYDELCNIIKNSNYNSFNYNLSLDNNKITILKEELLINKIINYSYGNINIYNLNDLLIKKGYEYRFNIEDNVTIIKSESLFYNKNHNKFEKENYDLGTVALITLSEYLNTFNDNKYFEIAQKLANGIISMQNNDGSFIHILNLDGSTKENFRTVFYDGEATLALLKFYQISNDNACLTHSQMAIDYFISNDYTKYRDHWISYAMREYLKYDTSDKYISFALDNYTMNINKFNKNAFSPTNLELLTTAYQTYYDLNDKNISNKTILNFNINELNEKINKELNILLSFYLTNSLSIYYKNPDKITGGFYSLNDNYRMRIDDIQHSLLGIINYQKIIK